MAIEQTGFFSARAAVAELVDETALQFKIFVCMGEWRNW